MLKNLLLVLLGMVLAMAVADPLTLREENAELKAEIAEWQEAAAPLVSLSGVREGRVSPQEVTPQNLDDSIGRFQFIRKIE